MKSALKIYLIGLVLTSIVLAANIAVTYSQDNLPEPITSGGVLTEQYWSADSRYFLYAYDGWRRYNLPTSTWISSQTWPLTLPLSNDEFTAFTPARNSYGNVEGLIFESPNLRYLAYATSAGLPGKTVFAVADRQNLKHQIIEDQSVADPFSLDGFNVLWNVDSTALLTTLRGDEGGLNSHIYVTNFASDVSETTTVDLGSALGNGFYVQQAYDLAVGNNAILLLVAVDDPSQPFLSTTGMDWHLLVWNLDDPSKSHLVGSIDGKQILAASFAPYDNHRLLILTHSRLFEYDWVTGEEYEVKLSFNLSETNSAMFSPSGEFLVLTQGGEQIAKTYLLTLFPEQTPVVGP